MSDHGNCPGKSRGIVRGIENDRGTTRGSLGRGISGVFSGGSLRGGIFQV